MIASLPMYDRPETRPAWDRLWSRTVAEARIRAKTSDKPAPPLPDRLTWDAPHDAHWCAPDLALSQTCSLPYRSGLHGQVKLHGAFDFRLPGCPPGYYNSVIVMRRDDERHAPENWPDLTFAYNAGDSQSGWAAPYAHFRSLKAIPSRGIVTGAHAASAMAVLKGTADIAALDAQTHRLLMRHWPPMEQLVEVARTEPTPGLPLISALGWDSAELWSAMTRAHDALDDETKTALDLHGLVAHSPDRYTALPIPPAPNEVFAP